MSSVSNRRSSRRIGVNDAATTVDENHAEPEDVDDQPIYPFEGVNYTSYQEMVKAKRQRNQQILVESGLLTAVQEAREAISKKPNPRGLQKRKIAASSENPTQRRKSNRLQGIQSDGLYVDDERGGNFTIVGADQSHVAADAPTTSRRPAEPEYYRDRVNDGAPLSLQQAVELTGPKWWNDDSVKHADQLVRATLLPLSSSYHTTKPEHANEEPVMSTTKKSPTSVSVNLDGSSLVKPSPQKSFLVSMDALQADDESCVAKVCPDRIYSIAVHPSERHLIVCAGDKLGHVGIWNADAAAATASSASDGVHLFRPHRGAVSCLQWTADSCLFSASYDGTVRWFDAASEQFEEIFAMYNENVAYKSKLGFGLDTGSHFWTQYACLDPRFSNEKCTFLSTSVGTAMHVDLRSKERITFHEELSEKKINTLSLHPNGNSLISAGLDCTVALWDLRKLGDSRTSKNRSKAPEPIAFYNGGRSVNSAFFSPSGRYVVSTTMANKLDIFENLHLCFEETAGSKKLPIVKPYKSIRHDNMTGRWLTTFQAIFHPRLDIFSVGSMRKPRCVEIFDPSVASGDGCLRSVSGDHLTAVASRLAFHPRGDRLILVGGNSSGRVTIIR